MTLPDLSGYLETRLRRHQERVGEQLLAMTRRERRLVREAAVMGYVRGAMFGESKANARHYKNPDLFPEPEFPGDRDIVFEVLSACDSMPDLYPVISHLTRPKEANNA